MKKLSLKWKKKKYLQACKILDLFNEKYNLCKIRYIKNKLTCNGMLSNELYLCCTDCRYLTTTGCSTHSLACKMNYCYFGDSLSENNLCKINDNKEIEFIKLQNLIQHYDKRMSFEDTFEYENKITHSNYNRYTAKWTSKPD